MVVYQRLLVTAVALLSTVSVFPLHAQQTSKDTVRLPEVTVFGSKAEIAETRRELARQPGGVAMVEPGVIAATRRANLKDVLQFVPGVWVAPRFGAADESQLSIRGSGLRNNFHMRGVNVLVNGMPYRNADGFTDLESLELMTTDAIQVYKGGNAFRYGGSTMGGAINLQTHTGYSAKLLDMTAEGGAFGFRKGQLSSGAHRGRVDYYGSITRTSLDGYRDWSDQGRTRFNAHLGYLLSDRTDLRAFYFYAHVTEHLPGSLTAADFANNTRSADPGNKANRWGREYDLHHVGLQLRTQLTPTQRIEVSPYFQYRDIDHPIFQVIAQQSRDIGAEVRYENSAALAGKPNRFTLGVQPTRLSMDNRQFVNVQGKHGDLKKDQTDHAGGVAVYAEDGWTVGDGVTLIAGLRYDRQTRRSEDHFLSDGNQSDNRVFEAVLPRFGVLVDVAGTRQQIFANATRSTEPPLLLELNSLAIPGFVNVAAQKAWQFEVGTRGRAGGVTWDVSLYDIELRHEILNLNVQPFPNAPFTVPTYRNAAESRHSGVEVGMSYAALLGLLTRENGGDAISIETSYTYGRNRFVRDSTLSGNQIPGVPEHVLHVAVRYLHPSGFTLTPSLAWVPQSYFVNSANTVKNEGWSTIGLRAEYAMAASGLTAFVAGDNLTNRRYSNSVQVDNAAGKWYEPADGRTFYAGMRLTR
ncbi:MAG: TonB-dependent receptor [Gemmatimonadota bacterium]